MSIVLSGQNCTLNVYQKQDVGVFVDVYADDVAIELAVLAHQVSPLIGRLYTGFIGQLMFLDTQGDADPDYLGFGDRWQFVYLDADETNALLQQS